MDVEAKLELAGEAAEWCSDEGRLVMWWMERRSTRGLHMLMMPVQGL
jgi:hypothetical protein